MGLAVGTQFFAPTAALAQIPANASVDAASDAGFPASIDEDAYFAEPEAITDITEEIDVDVVVVGAGASGVPAAAAAADGGATVAVVQKSPRAYGHGILFAGWGAPSIMEQRGYDEFTDDDYRAIKEAFVKGMHYGTQTNLLNAYMENSAEAMDWHFNTVQRLGHMVMVQGGGDDATGELDDNGLKACTYMVFDNVSLAHQSILEDYMETYGSDFQVHFSTPAMRLVTGDDGAVTGVIAQNRDGEHLQFSALKGVIIATGGYGGNADLMARWLPDSTCFTNGCYPEDNTGDSAMMAIWAGADIAPLRSKKIDIRFRGDHSARTNIEKQPFLLVNDQGVRIGNENSTEMEHCHFVSTNPSASGEYYCIFDSKFNDVLTSWGQDQAVVDDKTLAEYESFNPPLMWKANTIEDLADAIGVPAENLVATCERYTELAKAGYDEDFYKEARYLYELSTPPYYAMVREYTVGGTLGALKADANCNVISRQTGEPIPGLYVVGNDLGGLQTGQEYVWHDYGMTLGPCVTTGYMTGKLVAAL